MRVGPVAHGALTVLALGFAYQTWTRDKTEKPKAGEVTVWNESVGDFQSFAYDGENKSVKVEKRSEGDNTYYWGSVTTSKKPPKPKVPVKGDEPEKGVKDGEHGMPPGGPGARPPGAPGAMPPGAPGAKPGEKPASKPGEKPASKPGEKPATKPPTTAPAKPATKPAATTPAKPADKKPATTTPAKPAPSPHHLQAPPEAGEDEVDTLDDEDGTDTPDQGMSAPPVPEEMVTTTREFPIGKAGRELVASLAHLRALRDLGKLSDQQKEEYGLTDSKENLTVFFKGGKQYSLIIGERVFGGSDRYALQSETGRGYVLSHSEIMRHIDGAETSLGLKDLHRFQEDAEEEPPKTPQDPNMPKPAKDRYPGVQSIQIEGGKSTKELVRADSTDPKGVKTLGWASKDKAGQADISLSNFLSQIDRLRPTDYDSSVVESQLEKILTVTYKSGGGKALGQFEFFKKNVVTPEIKPGEGDDKDKPTVEYYVKSELTRIPGKVSKMAAERVEQDIPQLFGGGEIKDESKMPVPVGPDGHRHPPGAGSWRGKDAPKPAPGPAKPPTGAPGKPASGSTSTPAAPKAPAKPAGAPK